MHYNLIFIEKEPVKGENTWLEEGFKMTDDLLNGAAIKCTFILDLHAVPGGQGKMPIFLIMILLNHLFGKVKKIKKSGSLEKISRKI